MNVALTRGKFSCIIVGSSGSLIVNSHWKSLIDNAIDRHCCIPFFFFFYY